MSLNLKTLIGKLNETCRTAATRAASMCVAQGQYEVDLEHLFLALLEQPKSDFAIIARQCGISPGMLEADLQDAAKQRLQAKEDEVTTELRRGEPRIAIGDVSTSGGRLSFVVRDPTQLDAAFERMRTLTQPQGLTGTRDALDRLCEGLGIAYVKIPGATERDYTVDHSAALVLIDPEGRVAGYFTPPLKVDTLAADLQEIVRSAS